MHQDETQQAHCESEPTQGGGAAPEHRRCRYTKADGQSCRDWAVRGQSFCYRHLVFLRPQKGRHIDVPLLEDESSIVLVLSETLRALALGAIPVNNGRLILDGCRLAHTIQMERQKAADHRVRRGRKCMHEDERSEESEEIQEIEESQEVPDAECQERKPEPSQPDDGTRRADLEPPVATPLPHPSNPLHPRFNAVKKNQNKEPHTVEKETPNLSGLSCRENRQEVLAAHAAPLEEWMEEEALAVG
jgi:hypothetical protein